MCPIRILAKLSSHSRVMPKRVGDACVTPAFAKRRRDVSLAFVKLMTLGIASSLCTNKRLKLVTAQRLLDIFELSPILRGTFTSVIERLIN